jgi:hypothetical protein
MFLSHVLQVRPEFTDKHRKKGPLVDKLTCITSGSLLNLKLTDTIVCITKNFLLTLWTMNYAFGRKIWGIELYR